MGFPRWRFHKDLRPEGMIVHSEAQNAQLGEGWVDSPAEFEQALPKEALEAKPESAPETKAEAPKPAPAQESAAPSPARQGSVQKRMRKFLGGKNE